MKPTLSTHFDLIKCKYPDTLILFEVGEFFHLINEDAEIASQILGIPITEKPSPPAYKIAGFPVGELESNFYRLTKAFGRVAIVTPI